MAKRKIYVVLCEDCLEFASESRSYAENYIDMRRDRDVESVLKEQGYEEDEWNPKRIAEAALMAGYEGDGFDLRSVMIDEDHPDEVVLEDGFGVTGGEILDLLDNIREESLREEDFYERGDPDFEDWDDDF